MLLSEPVNIKKYPKAAEEAKRDEAIADCITRGDTHGNAMLLVFTLIKEGLLELSEEAYAELWAIYEASASGFTTKKLDRFKAILASGIYHPDACRLRLLGDLFADRGKNDALTLAVFEAMNAHAIQYNVMYSNHDHGFVRWLLGRSCGVRPVNSTNNLKRLLSRSAGIFSKKDVINSFDQFVLPHIKLIDYHFSPDEDPSITLFTHAPVGLETIIGAAMQLGVDYDESTPELLAASIDRINIKFKWLLGCKERELMRKLDHPKNPLDHLIWNRTAEPSLSGGVSCAKESGEILVKRLRFEPINKSYRVHFVHGHDGAYTPRQPNRTNLDGDLGKGGCAYSGEPYITFRQHMRPELTAEKVADTGLTGGASAAAVPVSSLFAPAAAEPPVGRELEEADAPAVATGAGRLVT